MLDLANNHQGSVAHGHAIIDGCADAVRSMACGPPIKFQFRDLPEFVHKDERANPANKHVPRFLSTRLTGTSSASCSCVIKRQRLALDVHAVRRGLGRQDRRDGLRHHQGGELLGARLAAAREDRRRGLPVIASTGGLAQQEVDDLVSFFDHRGCDFALMHCVSIYPTPDEPATSRNIASSASATRPTYRLVDARAPQDTAHVLAAALGAEMFERHVGVATDNIKLNAYSSTPAADRCLDGCGRGRKATLIGSACAAAPLDVREDRDRRAQARRVRAVGHRGGSDDRRVTRSISRSPIAPVSLSPASGRPASSRTLRSKPDAPLSKAAVEVPDDPDKLVIKSAIHEVKALLTYARVPLTHEFTTEYSHHYGVANFREVGAVLINVINRDMQKVLVQLPGQMHPWHFHKLKEETFLVLWGELISELDGREQVLRPGDTLTVPPGVWHCFWTETGCVFEEISTTAFPNDSVYRDPAINKLTSEQRKTSSITGAASS